MRNPKIILKLDINTDIENCLNFVKYNLKENPKYIKWFLPKEIHYVLERKADKLNLNKILKEYTANTFKAHYEKIKENLIKSERDWKNVENRYFNLVNKIFKNHPWPKGRYIGFASIFRMYPRNIRNKTFFFPVITYSKQTPPVAAVIGHEVLHFMFFDYVKKRYNLNTDSEIKGKEKRYLWKISEVFNSVIENWKPYHRIFKFRTTPYTGKDFYKKMKRQWNKNQDIDWFLDQWLRI